MDRARRLALVVLVALAPAVVGGGPGASAQQLLDRVVARVGATVVTLTDLREVVGLGLVDPGLDGAATLEAVIDRQLVLDEVARFPPAEPTEAAVAEEVDAMKAHAGAGLDALLAETGSNEGRLRALARQSLLSRVYLAQRFGTSAQVLDSDVRAYFDAHPDEFTRDGVRIPYEEAAPAARALAAADRLRARIEQWTRDLRARAEIVRVDP